MTLTMWLITAVLTFSLLGVIEPVKVEEKKPSQAQIIIIENSEVHINGKIDPTKPQLKPEQSQTK